MRPKEEGTLVKNKLKLSNTTKTLLRSRKIWKPKSPKSKKKLPIRLPLEPSTKMLEIQTTEMLKPEKD